MRKKFLIFLGIFIFMIIPKNVFAKEVIPYVSSVNNTTYSSDFINSGSYISTTINANSYSDFTIRIQTMELTNVGYDTDYPTFTDFPYVWLFFEMYNSSSQISISRTSTCNTSCFNGQNMILKQIGVNPSNNRKRYVLILPVLKTSFEWGTQYTFHEVADILRFENLSSSDRKFAITNILMSDNANVESVSDFSSIIDNANSNTTTIINNVNAVKSAIDTAKNAIDSMKNALSGKIDTTNQKLDNYNQTQQQTNQKLDNIDNTMKNDSIDTSQSNSFFSSFSTTDNGGISSILTAPLVAINKMLDNQCSPLTTTYKGKEISLPCGTQFWEQMPTIKTFLTTIESGILSYFIIKKLFELIHNLKDPENDKVEVMDL